MGTNYYVDIESDKCECCGRSNEVTLHMGKFSVGWRFMLRVQPNYWHNTYELIEYILRSRGKDNVTISNDNNASDNPADIVQRIMEVKNLSVHPHRIAQDDLSDHSDRDFS